jgi:CRISPR system Cascade subunit CasB
VTELSPRRRSDFYWEQFSVRMPPGDELAALRRGLGREPGTVPSMWRFYRTWRAGDRRYAPLAAEHHTLTLFAVHQQSQPRLVHREKTPIAEAIRRLHTTGRFTQEAIDRRFFAAVTAPEVDEVAYHLRGLVRQLRSLPEPTPFDHTQLYWDLLGWSTRGGRERAQRSWGLDYYRKRSADDTASHTIEGDL